MVNKSLFKVLQVVGTHSNLTYGFWESVYDKDRGKTYRGGIYMIKVLFFASIVLSFNLGL